MKTTLTENDFLNFWIRVYFPGSNNLIDASIDRAYRDFNRTMHQIKDKRTDEKYNVLKNFMKSIVEEVSVKSFVTQDKFDYWHKNKCIALIDKFNEVLVFKIGFGQAQKWINMSFKYLFVLGDSRTNLNISKNYHLFHIPIDNIIQKKLSIEYNIPRINGAWSRIDNYDDYLNYQKAVRNKFVGQIPMDVEFKLFNEL